MSPIKEATFNTNNSKHPILSNNYEFKRNLSNGAYIMINSSKFSVLNNF